MHLPTYALRAGWDPKLIFKQSTAGLDTEFSCSYTGFCNRIKEPSPPTITHSLGKIWIHNFLNGITTMRIANKLVQDLNSCQRAYFTR